MQGAATKDQQRFFEERATPQIGLSRPKDERRYLLNTLLVRIIRRFRVASEDIRHHSAFGAQLKIRELYSHLSYYTEPSRENDSDRVAERSPTSVESRKAVADARQTDATLGSIKKYD